MIFYFSGTGNSKYVAERIASAFNDIAVSIENTDTNVQLKDNEILGFVALTTWFQISPLMREFIQNANINTSNGNHYTFYVATYGSSPGFHGEDARRTLKRKDIHLDASYSIKQPDTWTPIFDLSDKEHVAQINKQAEIQIDKIIDCIKRKEQGNHTQKRWPYFIRPITNYLLKKERQTKNFYVENTCIGCGLCVKKCPVQAIEIKDKKPTWAKTECALCLRCLHHCPKFAIQYGNGKTKQHGQYKNPNVRV